MSDTKQISVKTFNHPTNGARYQSILDSGEHQWMIVDSQSGLVACSGYMVSAHKQKIKAKEALITLGIEFATEDRYTKAEKAQEEVQQDAEQIG